MTTSTSTSGTVNKTPTNATSSSTVLKNAVISNKERISNLEHALQQLISRVNSLENENRELRTQLNSVVPVPISQPVSHDPPVIPEPIVTEADPTPDEPNSGDGEWVTVVNKRNRIIKKTWKNEHKPDEYVNSKKRRNFNRPNIGNNNGHPNSRNRSNTCVSRNKRRNSNFVRDENRYSHPQPHTNLGVYPQHGNHGFGYADNHHNSGQMSQLVNNLSNFLIQQTRQVPIYRNRFF